MDELLMELNIWAILVGGVAYFMIGWLWYGPLFGKAWMREKGMMEHPESPDPKIFLYSLLLQLIAVLALGLAVAGLQMNTALGGLHTGLVASVGFILTTMGVNGLYNDVSLKLFSIDAGYHLTGLALAGLILGAW